jgi:hypothetical protein
MVNKLALIGGEEFADAFQDVHASLVADLGGKPRVAFLPTPAANDGIETVEHWCSLAREKLSALGAMVDTPRVVDRESANDPRYVQQVGFISAAGHLLQSLGGLAAVLWAGYTIFVFLPAIVPAPPSKQQGVPPSRTPKITPSKTPVVPPPLLPQFHRRLHPLSRFLILPPALPRKASFSTKNMTGIISMFTVLADSKIIAKFCGLYRQSKDSCGNRWCNHYMRKTRPLS